MTVETVALALPTLTLSSDEVALVQEMLARLEKYEVANKLKEAYYEGTHRVRNLGISIPPHMQDLNTVVAWPTIAVDSLDERLDWQGWVTDDGDDFGLSDIYRANDLDVESGQIHLDALIYGISFVTVGTGLDGEPNPLITVESARHMTGIWNPRARRLSAALKVTETRNGMVTEITLYLPNETIWATFKDGNWYAIDRDEHTLGRVPVAQLVNRPRASRIGGKSEITRAMRSLTDMGVRTMLGMEVNREFYSAPQRYLLGADGSAFQDADGNPIPAWQTIMGRMMSIPAQPVNPDDPDGEYANPEIGQFTAASPSPYLDQIRGLSQMAASEAAVPVHYLGFVSENPASADAIRAGEARLIKRAEKHQLMFGKSWREVGRLAILVRDGELPDNIGDLDVKWRDPATPTRSAAADEVVKLIGAGVMPANSTVARDRMGMSPQEQRQLENEERKATSTQRLADIRAAVTAGSETAQDAPVTEQ